VPADVTAVEKDTGLVKAIDLDTEPTSAVHCTISVVICSYADWRWREFREACASVRAQLAEGDELVVVVDHNDRLLAEARADLPWARVAANEGRQGLSDARNTGVRLSRGDVVAFLDDDAAARPGWLAGLRESFEESEVAVVGTAVWPRWEGGRPPRWFPAEFGWVIGCSYRGLPEVKATVRNPIGASMAVRRAVFAQVGTFSKAIGRVGTTPVGCEETEFCIRVAAGGGRQVIFNPRYAVDHSVPAARQTARYFVRRCYHEGRSKRIVSLLQGTGAGLASERRYVRVTLPAAVFRNVAGAGRRPAGLLRAVAILLGLTSTVLGYAVESTRRGPLAGAGRSGPAPVREPAGRHR
jgi:glucosyl-dolichyl phosphate glucuronosyltransferase